MGCVFNQWFLQTQQGQMNLAKIYPKPSFIYSFWVLGEAGNPAIFDTQLGESQKILWWPASQPTPPP